LGIDNHLGPDREGDGEVLEAARGGDRNALEALVTAHYDRVHTLCRRMLGNDADALDATQDALLAAIRALSRFDRRSSFGTWLYRIATNTCIDEIRRRRRRPVTGFAADIAEVADVISARPPGLFVPPPRPGSNRFDTPSDGELGWHGGEHGATLGGSGLVGTGRVAGGAGGGRGSGGDRDPADVVAARVDVDAALAMLPVEFRTAVVLRDVCDLPYEEIANILGVPVGTVRSRIARGRSALAAIWKPAGATTSDGAAQRMSGNRGVSPDVETDENDSAPRAGAPRARRAPPGQGRLPEANAEQSQREEHTP
jgi:RNA polymerase sigma-70 factor (ECF subfamily)